MESFAATVDQSFQEAEAKARQIGTFLTDQTQAVAGVIGGQFEEIRAESGKERERTGLALRAAYEQANTEMAQIFGQSIDRFKASATAWPFGATRLTRP